MYGGYGDGYGSQATATMTGWYDLQAILDEQRQELIASREDPPVACPNDGEPLQTLDDGRLWCPFDGWIWDGITAV